MTRKDYVLIGEAIKSEREDWLQFGQQGDKATACLTLDQLSGLLADKLLADNAAFDHHRFMKACGVLQ